MAIDPEGWFSPQTIEKHAPGMIAGAVFATAVLLRLVKSGFLVFGDKVKLLAENAVLKEKLAQKELEIARLKALN